MHFELDHTAGEVSESGTPGWRLAVSAGILGWILESFDFFVVVFLSYTHSPAGLRMAGHVLCWISRSLVDRDADDVRSESVAWELHKTTSLKKIFGTLLEYEVVFGYLLLVMVAMNCLSLTTLARSWVG